jgi:hypothetical protein
MPRRPTSRAPHRAAPAHAAPGTRGAASYPRTLLVAPAHYALARHRATRGLWVFELRGTSLVGVCGPLEGDPPPAWLLPHFDFASADARSSLPIVRARLDEFDRLA